MSKIFSSVPVFIQNLEELKKIEKNYIRKQYIQYNCIKCGNFYKKKLYMLRNCGYQLLCYSCFYKKSIFEKYGVENPRQLESVKEKYKQTCLKRYGEIHPNKNKEIRKKGKVTCLKKYGIENPSQLQEVKEKKKQTCLKHYGVENPNYIPNHNEKVRETCLKKYGVTNPTYLPNHNEKVKLIRSLKSFEELKAIRSRTRRKYIYENIRFDSSWELAVWIWALENGKNIEREPISFEYESEGEKYTYYPDFQIGDKLIEIKGPQFFKEDGTMQNPFDHSQDVQFEAKHQCGLRHGVEFWSKKEMKPVLEYVKNKYGKNYLQKFKQY